MPAKKSLLARVAETAPRTPTENGRRSALFTTPGLYDELARVIESQRQKPPHKRLGMHQLHALVRECYPSYKGEYAGFRNWVIKHFQYRGQKEQA